VALWIAHNAAANFVGVLDEQVLLFTRAGPLTTTALDHCEAIINERVSKATSAKPVASLVVLPGDVGLSRHDLIDRQRRLFDRLKAERFVFSAACVLGTSAQCVAMRAVVRLFLLGRPKMKLFSEVEPATLWLARATSVDAAHMREASQDAAAARSAALQR
jgi:hypothetical protein